MSKLNFRCFIFAAGVAVVGVEAAYQYCAIVAEVIAMPTAAGRCRQRLRLKGRCETCCKLLFVGRKWMMQRAPAAGGDGR